LPKLAQASWVVLILFATHAPQPFGQAAPASPLNFEVYRSRIEPIFLKQRPSGMRCYDCHSAIATRLRLQPLAQGNSSWTEEQSRQNFEAVSQLVVPSAPLESRLLLHPLATEEGGDPTHTGGKFWQSRQDPEWQLVANWIGGASSGAPSSGSSARPQDTPELDFFATRVQPIFLKERPGHARCYGCHTEANRIFRLEPLPPGAPAWTSEQARRNYQSAVQQVAPGDPGSSRLLMHPLAPEAGGDPFHSGGRQFQSENDPDWLILAQWVRDLKRESISSSGGGARIYVTNSAADTVDVVDASTNKVVQVIRGIELPHGVVFSPDGSRVYISNESESTLDVVDSHTGEILHKVPLSGRPNNLAITKDGERVLVGIRRPRAAVDIISASSLRRLNTIPMNGSVHNIYVTPDGKFAVSGSIEAKIMTVLDLQKNEAVWEVKFDQGVRPMTFAVNANGSTGRIFLQLSNFNGFAVVDFAKRAEVARIKLPDEPSGFGIAEGRMGTPSHGIGVAPDGKSLWVNSTVANAVFKYSLPDLTVMGYAPLPLVHSLGAERSGAVPEWITFTPDSKRVYVSNSGARSVSVIDSQTIKPIALIPVGEVPKRMNTLVMR
jgi:YVTN family beta-propeller protein